MHKLSSVNDGEWREHRYPRYFVIQNPEQANTRLLAALGDDAKAVFERLALLLKPPYCLLYILHTPRGEAKAGRYQSEWLKASELCSLLHKYESYFTTDARFDLWVYSPEDAATLVWDRHNLLYSYGSLDLFSDALIEFGYSTGQVSVPGPHQHHYHADNDAYALSLLTETDWSWSELRTEDEQ